LTKAGAGILFAAIVLASFISTGAAFAQSQSAQASPQIQPAQPQSTNQIVLADQKPLEPKPASALESVALPPKPLEAEPVVELQTVVIPPSPVIVKRNTNAILIPAEGVAASPRPNAEFDYEERPAVSSSVSVGSSFGYRRDPFTRRAKFHSGADIKARWGDPVGASQAGTVQFAGWYHGYGNMIIVAHGGGVTTHYAHLSSFDVQVGARVERGTVLGRAGSTGRATSPHLHYEVRIDGNPMNPFQPLALDPSSDYFKQSRPTVDAGRVDVAPVAGSQRDK
jgi:murein DD-endopeptidase MepM/ murein hydrolase activator NlpD